MFGLHYYITYPPTNEMIVPASNHGAKKRGLSPSTIVRGKDEGHSGIKTTALERSFRFSNCSKHGFQ